MNAEDDGSIPTWVLVAAGVGLLFLLLKSKQAAAGQPATTLLPSLAPQGSSGSVPLLPGSSAANPGSVTAPSTQMTIQPVAAPNVSQPDTGIDQGLIDDLVTDPDYWLPLE